VGGFNEKLRFLDDPVSFVVARLRRWVVVATEEIQRNVEAAKLQLRTEVADLAIKATEKILEETLDEKRQKQLIDSVMNKLPKN